MSRTVHKYQVVELWEDDDLILDRAIVRLAESEGAPFAVLDEDCLVISAHATFSDAWAAVRAEMVTAPAAIGPGPGPAAGKEGEMGIDQDGELVARLGAIRDWMERDGSGADADAIGAAIARLSANPPRPAIIACIKDSDRKNRFVAFESADDAGEFMLKNRYYSFSEIDRWEWHPKSREPGPVAGEARVT